MVFEGIIDLTLERRRKEAEGQFDLFASLEPESGSSVPEMRHPIPEVEFDKKPRLAFEKEMLGLYVSDHPLMGPRPRCAAAPTAPSPKVESSENGSRTVGGVVTTLQRKWTKKGDLMAVFILEDLQISIEVMVFPKTMRPTATSSRTMPWWW